MDEVVKTRLRILGLALLLAAVAWGVVAVFSGGSHPAGPAVEPLPEHPVKAGSPAVRTDDFGLDSLRYNKYTVIGDIRGIPYADKVKSGILIDMDTRRVLWAKDPRMALPIASVSKVMTLLMALEEMEKNPAISPDEKISVTTESAKITEGGLRVAVGTEVTLNELFEAMMIGSKNDAAYLVAARFGSGSVPDFVERMNRRAAEMGLKKAFFSNPHGLPDKIRGDNRATAEEVLVFSHALMRYPAVLKWTSTPSAKILGGKVTLYSTNHLMSRRRTRGVDGLKTGYTRRAKSCLVFTCQRDGKRLLGVVLGVDGSDNRDDFCAALIEWAYRRLGAAKTK